MQHKEQLVHLLQTLRDKVEVGTIITGLYAASTLRLGVDQIKVFRMTVSVYTAKRPMTPWLLQLDNRRNDSHTAPPDLKKKYFDDVSVENSLVNLGRQFPSNPSTTGWKLVESIFSHRDFTFDEDVVFVEDQERKDLSYMKKEVMHRIGPSMDSSTRPQSFSSSGTPRSPSNTTTTGTECKDCATPEQASNDSSTADSQATNSRM